jgi:RNA polymerase sigma-70 factor (ECF subfamily)
MNDANCPSLPTHAEVSVPERETRGAPERVRSVIERHYDFVWRTLQYAGMPEASAQDGAQEVMCVLARRIGDIQPGAETSFLFSTALRVAADWRRSARRRPPASDDVDLDALVAEAPSIEELVDQRRARELLGKVLDAIAVELRIVFVLYEIEELTMPEIAEIVGAPVGTVASRLRRARETFQSILGRMRARGEAP